MISVGKASVFFGLFLVCGGSWAGEISLDPFFGNQGKVLIQLSRRGDRVEGVAIQKDGKIVVAGVGDVAGGADFIIVRLLVNGELDSSFGVGGVVRLDLGGKEKVFGLVIQKNGKIIVGGASRDFHKSVLALARFTSNGDLDKAFGQGGVVKTAVGDQAEIHYLVLQPDSKILAVGFSSQKKNRSIVVARYHSDGKLDHAFGNNGLMTSLFSSQDFGYGMALHPDGKIIVAGSIQRSPGDDEAVLIRYHANGQLDPGFGTKGIVKINVGSSQDLFSSAALQPDGKILAAGFSMQPQNRSDLLVVRFHSNGSLDKTFSGKGWQLYDHQHGYDLAHAIAFSRRKILVAGEISQRKTVSWKRRQSRFLFISILEDGTMERTMPISFQETGNQSAEAMAIQEDGKVVLVGYANKGLAITRLIP